MDTPAAASASRGYFVRTTRTETWMFLMSKCRSKLLTSGDNGSGGSEALPPM